ncbi:MAG TPA: hypothetical protein VH593_21095 [Ktedonobacteraceae bacterium]
MRVYLGGAINGRPDSECVDWRRYAASQLTAEAIDPMVRDYRGREDDCVAEIVELDKADIDSVDALLVYYDRPSVGTSMEILYAWERDKRIILVNECGGSLSPWLKYHSHVVVDSLDKGINVLNNINDLLIGWGLDKGVRHS